MLFLDAVIACLEDLDRAGRSAPTLDAYRRDLLLYGRFVARSLDLPLDELTIEACASLGVDAYLGELREVRRNAPATVARRLASLRALYRTTWRRAGLPHNPAERAASPVGRQRSVPALDLASARALLRAAAHQSATPLRDALLISLALGNGLTLAELTRLDGRDVDLARGVLTVRGRRGRARQVPLSEAAARLLGRHLAQQGSGPLWTNRRGERLSARGVQYVFARAGRRAQIARPASAQALRNTARRLMRRAGASPSALRRLLGVESAV